MISEALLSKIKALFKSIWSDENGNVEIGKDLVVDGKIRINEIDDIVGSKGSSIIEKHFHHSLTITAGTAIYYADVVLPTNSNINSLQDLSTYAGKSKKIGLGTRQLAFDSSAGIWKAGSEPVTDVKDSVTTI